MKKFVYMTMTDQIRGMRFRLLAALLGFLEIFYGALVWFRNIFYAVKCCRPGKVSARVISVGNITFGGTGKTPLVRYLARKILKLNKKPAILLRGYGNDESEMLRNPNDKIPVYVGRNRLKVAQKYAQSEAIDVFLLDDGFQHRKMARDLDIVVVDATNPFGNTHLIPRGILREHLHSLKRADVIILSKIDGASQPLAQIENRIRKFNAHAPFVHLKFTAKGIFNLVNSQNTNPQALKGRKALIVSAIGNPDYFLKTCENIGIKIVGECRYMDHKEYGPGDIDDIIARAHLLNQKTILTTEKDSVKLIMYAQRFNEAGIQIYYIKIEPEIIHNEQIIAERLNRLLHI